MLGLVGASLAILLGIIPLLLLVFKRTRIIGCIVSIVIGILAILLKQYIMGLALVVAAIVAFVKKI